MQKNALSQHTNVSKEDVDNALDVLEQFLQDILVDTKVPSSYEIEKTYGLRQALFYKYRSGKNELRMMRLREIGKIRDHVWQYD